MSWLSRWTLTTQASPCKEPPPLLGGGEEGKKGWERQNKVMTILVFKLKRTSKCFLKQTTHPTLPQPTKTIILPCVFSLNTLIVSHKHTPFNKTGAEIPNTSGARQRRGTECYLSTVKSGNNARNFKLQVSSKQKYSNSLRSVKNCPRQVQEP